MSHPYLTATAMAASLNERPTGFGLVTFDGVTRLLKSIVAQATGACAAGWRIGRTGVGLARWDRMGDVQDRAIDSEAIDEFIG